MNERRTPIGRTPLGWRSLGLWAGLTVSLALNVALVFASFEFYRREQRVRLTPTHPPPAPVARVNGRVQVLLLGDSRMSDWPSLPGERFLTVNAGGGGETTTQVLLRAAATLDAVEPEVVVLQAGINDLKTIGALPDVARDTEMRCLANLTALVELCRARGARVVLVPVLPAAQPSLVRRLVWSSAIDAARVRVNRALRQRFVGVSGVAVLDEQRLHFDTAVDYRDTLHFRPEGYQKLQAAALHAIDSF